jgi:putative photosynthetic complex assembly protein 2
MSLSLIGLSILFTVFVWWASTGAILWLDRRFGAGRRAGIIGLSLVALAGLLGLFVSLDDATPRGAVIAFSSSLAIWGWHEGAFLMGIVTGPSKLACPMRATGWMRFRKASATLIHHEIALAVTLALLALASLGHTNSMALWTFGVLFVSRLSAKFNLFLGVPNFSVEFFPDRLAYLTTYLRKSPGNWLMPVSLMAGGAGLWIEWRALAGADAFLVVGLSLVMTLTALAMIEHLFMLLPIADGTLWKWALPSPTKSALSPSPTRPAQTAPQTSD